MKNLDSLTGRSFALLCCTLGLADCTRDDSIGNNTKKDASAAPETNPTPDGPPIWPDLGVPGPDSEPAPDTSSVSPSDAWSCSALPRVDDAGVSQWSWFFHWSSSEPLASVCASYGAAAKMVLEVDFPTDPGASRSLPDCTSDEIRNGTTRACGIAGAYRFEVDCTAGQLFFDLPNENTIHAWYHMEGSRVTQIRRYVVSQGVECARTISVIGFAAAPTPDGGPDSLSGPSDGPACSFDGGGLPGSYEACVATGGAVIKATATTPTFCVQTYLENFGNRSDYTSCRAAGGYAGMFDVYGCDGPVGGGYCQVYYPQSACPTVSKPVDYWWPIPSCNDFTPRDAGPADSMMCSFDDGGVLPRSYDACVAAGGKVVGATSVAPTFCEMLYDTTLFPTRPGFEQCRAVGGFLVAWDGDAAGGTTCFVFYPQNGCPTGPKPDGWTWSY